MPDGQAFRPCLSAPGPRQTMVIQPLRE